MALINMFNTVLMLGLLTGILLGTGFLLGGLLGALIALIFAFVINFFSYWYSDRMVLRIYGAQRLEDPEINSIVEKLARDAKIPKPRVYRIDEDSPNAFATGRNPQNSAVAVTRGLKKLNKKEIEAVLSHEMGHIRNRDTLIQTVAATIGGAVAFLAQMSYYSLLLGGRRRGAESLLGVVFIVIFAPLAAFLIRMAISRNREYKADYTGATISRKPGALASALRKISSSCHSKPIKGPSATSHLWIINPFESDWFTGLFSTHPPIEKRVEKLEEMKEPLH